MQKIGILHPGAMGSSIAAAVEIYQRIAHLKDAPDTPSADIVAALDRGES